MAETVDIEPILKQATEELTRLQTIGEVRAWWEKYYLTLGHRRLGRLLIGRPVEGRPRERE